MIRPAARVCALLTLLTMVASVGVANPGARSIRAEIPGFGFYDVDPVAGLRFSDDGGRSFSNRSAGLPVKLIYPFERTVVREILDLSVDPLEPERIAVVADTGIYRSDDGGITWSALETGSPISRVEVYTSILRLPGEPETFFLGSSFNGLYITRNGGETWESLEDSLPDLSYGAGFNEAIVALAADPSNPDRIAVGAGFGGGVFETRDGGESWDPVEISEQGEILELRYEEAGTESLLAVTMSESGSEATPSGDPRVAGRTGLYVNSAHASGDALAAHLETLAEHGMNSLVVDMKDDSGYLTYDTDLEFPRSIGAVRSRFDLDELVAATDEAEVWLIGRVVVFQDPRLYRYDEGAYAVWDESEEKPWGNLIPVRDSEGKIIRTEQREFWVDPYSEAVWDYHIDIARELADRGVDEVQFDYIRFPSDGDLSTASYRFARKGMTKTDALESFLKKASLELELPIGIDIFGFNGFYRMGNWIGQNLSVLARWVDVVSPMFYPSHYPRAYLSDLAYFDRAEEIYRSGTDRARRLVEGTAYIRPYVQAFLIGGERAYEEAEYDLYLTSQLDGVIGGGASGFTLWNASNNYYMIVSSLLPWAEASVFGSDENE